MIYKVVVCPKCRMAQLIYASKTFKCRGCGYTTHVKNIKIWYMTENSREARAYLLKLKEVLMKNGLKVR